MPTSVDEVREVVRAAAAFGAAAGKDWRHYDSVLIIAVIAFFYQIFFGLGYSETDQKILVTRLDDNLHPVMSFGGVHVRPSSADR